VGRATIRTSAYEPKPLVGYADPLTARPGETVRFYVNCQGVERYRADLVRLIHGDVAPAGPGFKERVITSSSVNGEYSGRVQITEAGSYALIDDPSGLLNPFNGLTLQAMIWPTTPELGRPQSIISKWNQSQQTGYALVVDGDGCPAFWIGEGEGRIQRFTTGRKLWNRVWYLLAVAMDRAAKTVTLVQQPIIGLANSRIAIPFRVDDTTAVVKAKFREFITTFPTSAVIAGWQERVLDSGRFIGGGKFNGKIDRPRIFTRALDPEEINRAIEVPDEVEGLVAAWDFAANHTRQGITDIDLAVDRSANRLHGTFVNLPTHAVTGYNWSADVYDYTQAPEQYGAVHFHDDDLDDCRWEDPVEYAIPNSTPSGVYALRIRAEMDGQEVEDYLPFFVGPNRRTLSGRKIAILIPTATYLAYANDHLAADTGGIELTSGAIPRFGELDMAKHLHREYGASCYDIHSDGSGVCYSSWRRPLLTVRPKYRGFAVIWLLNADLRLVDWFDTKGYETDVITDQDLHNEGAELLTKYKLVVTPSHPEYYSGRMLNGLHEFVTAGGRLIYLGGNGFYWVTGFHPEKPQVIEVRRWGGSEPWTAEPGQYYLSFTGEMGGIWKNRGRPPQKLVGVGFIAQGLDRSTYYKRKADSFTREAEWIFEGVGVDEKIGDYGLDLGGAAGVEIDCYDPMLGSPRQAHLVASSEDHSRLMLKVREELGATSPYSGGDMDSSVRSDIVYFKAPNGGAVFSTGSMSWCGSLSYNDYNNNVSRITENVVRMFEADKPLP
jgi:N,N-dimethylformamidase